MAEFKLGRIKFVWQGVWTNGHNYVVDDVVSNGGKSYICVLSHTSSGAFATDLAAIPTYWNLISDGLSWRGDWAPSTYYNVGDQVKYGGIVYVCKTVHTSATNVSPTYLGLENDQSKWDIFATSFYWAGTWTTSTKYRVRDFVVYGGVTYVCKTAHISNSSAASGLEADQSKWDTFNQGVTFLGSWSGSSVRYKLNDVVKYGADLWICNTAHTSTSTFDSAKFTIFVNGLQFESSWAIGTTYQVGDVVTYGGNSYIAITNNIGLQPNTNTSDWAAYTTGFNFRGDWDNSAAYKVGDVIRLGGYTYLCTADNSGTTPPNSGYWNTLASGVKWNPSTGTYSGISGTNIVGSGTSATFNVTRTGTIYNVTVATGGSNYATNDTIKILGTQVGGLSPANDLIITVTGLTGNAINTISRTGISVTWSSGVTYVLGDVVMWGASSFICVSAHIAGSGNRPDNDTSATYWNLLSSGAESAVLTTKGDTFYYGANGATRLPIGTDGQILRVKDGLPAWSYYGVINNLVYVAPTGTNGPASAGWGLTVDKPWASVRYACEQVENGYLNPNATELLRKNKQFLMKEVTNWVNYTYKVTIASASSSTNQFTLAAGLTTTGASVTNGVATITFASQSLPPFAVGQTIVVAGVTPNGYNGSAVVTACTTTSVSFASSASGNQAVAGTVGGSTAALVANMPISFTSTTGGVTAGTTYYVKTIVDSTNFTISNQSNGTVRNLTTQSGTMTGSLVYDQTYCERDTGLLVEAITFDLGHGGNSQSVKAAKAYFSALGNSFITSNFGAQTTQSVAAYNYLKTIVANVLANTAPVTNYQVRNSVAVTANQIIDSTLTAETAATATTNTLLSIITNAISAGSVTAVPTASQPNTTISVKTGTYFEVLPIVVPANTAIVGDELRGTVVQPQPAIATLVNDKAKTISALNRIKAVVPNLIANTTVTPTSGNTQTQVTTLPAGDVGSTLATTRVVANAQLMYDIINNGLTEVPAFVLPTPTGYNTSFLAGYGDGKAQIVQNYAFIKAEISAYLNTNYNSVWTALGATGQANCTRDVGYLLDALQFDMTYGGNVQSLIAGSAYYSYSQLDIASTELTAIIAAYGRLNTIIGQIATKTTVTPTAGNVTSQVTTGTAGSAGSATFAQARIADVTSWITNGVAPSSVAPDTSWVSASLLAANTALQAKKSEIQADTVVWVKKFFQNMNFNTSTCSRDAGIIVDALCYDTMFGSNFNSIKVGMSYFRALTSVSTVMTNQKAAELGAINFIKYKAKHIAASGAVAQISNSIDDITSFITGGAVPRYLWPDYTGIDAQDTLAAKLIWQNKEFLKAEVIAYITANYPGVVYSQSICARDVGYIVDAVRYDMQYGGNYATRQAGLAYFSGTTLQIASGEKAATIAAYGQLKLAMQAISTGSAYTVLNSASVARVTGAVGDSASSTLVGNLIDGITTTINNIANVPSETLPSTSWVDSGLTTQNSSLQSAKSTIQANVISYINTNYPVLVYNSATCSRDVGYIIDAIGYDFMMNSNYRSILSGISYYRAQAVNVVGSQKEATIAAFNYLKLQIASTVSTNATALARANANMQIIIDILDKGVGETPEIHGTVTYNNTLATIKGAEILRANKTFLAYEATAWITQSYGGTVSSLASSGNVVNTSAAHNLVVGDLVVFSGTSAGGLTTGTTYYVLTVPSTTSLTVTATQGSSTPVTLSTVSSPTLTVRYSFDATSCRRDMTSYIDALIYDLQYTGIYKGLRAAKLYNNAVGGSIKSDMYLVRNGTGIRNQTLSGLTGSLTNPNSYGTKRPTAGAYVSLDPGFGPNDTNVWITTRSCYSQNVTMFGTGCTGGKIDGALHAGGNRSTVANDFTTIISDGIGVWCTGSGALTELVSVFNYYGYAGYLAELGGKIRATNGNSSYGTYGVVAEGVDTYETPIYGIVDNRANQAQITNTVTDLTNAILRFEYGNAGTGYTNTVHSISGSGFNATAVGDEFRDGAVYETRIIDKNDGNGVGGTSYASQANASQGGDKVSITIAATDVALNNAYVGMRIQITAGSGVGQYANILTYGSGSKVAQVYKDSFTNLTVTGSTTTVLQVADTSTLYVNMPIYLSATTAGILTANTTYYIESVASSTTFTVKSTTGGSAITGLTATSAQTITLYAAGWDHVVPGTTIVNLDLTSTYIIEPRISYSAPGYTATARSMYTSGTWQNAYYGAGRFVAVGSGGTLSSYSADGKTWATAGALPSSQTWSDIVYGGGEAAVGTAIVGGLGGSGAVLVAVLGVPNTTGAALADQVATVTVVSGGQNYTTPPTIVFTPTNGGTGATATCTVLNGKIINVTVTIPGSGYNAVPTVAAATDRITSIRADDWGKNYFGTPTITVSAPDAAVGATAWTSSGTATLNSYYYYNNAGTINYYKATVGGTFTTTGPIHTSGSTSNGTATLLYVATGATATPVMTNNGVSGYTMTNNGNGYVTTPTVTILDTNAKYVAISSASNNSAYTTAAGVLAGSNWTAGGSTAKTDLVSLTYGGGVYVAVGGTSGTASAVSSTDGTTWISRTITALGGGNYSSVAYGGTTFVAIQTGGVITSYSTNGNTWTQGGNLPNLGSNTWTSVAYGNGRFVAIQGTSSKSVAYSIDAGVTWTAAPAGLPATAAWTHIEYGQGLFFAVASGTNIAASSPDGINWTSRTMPSSTNWRGLAFGNPGNVPTWVATSITAGTAAASINTGAKALGRVKVAGGVVTEIRMIEPGSAYPKGTVTATTVTSNLITASTTENLVDSQPIEFFGTGIGGLSTTTTYYVIGSTITSTQFKVSATAGSSTAVTLSTATSSGTALTYKAGPVTTITDPNKVKAVNFRVRLGDGALGNPTFTNRGLNNTTATSSTQGDGYGDLYQPSNYINVAGLFSMPAPGANVEFASLPGVYFKLVSVTNILGIAGNYTAQFQINPSLTTLQAPAHGDVITTRLNYSQTRLTGHDFLYIGTGNQSKTNYPFVDITTAVQANQELFTGGGRVFFTSTDQDGNFNVGNLFGVQQATGTATLNASAFNLAGLQSLQLGAVSIGVGSAIITQFSTDPYFTANSDNIVPTQRAIKAYITAQIGGGSSALNVNTLTSGVIYVANNTITTTSGIQINVTSKMNFTGGIDGAPVALGFFMQK